MTPLVLIHGGGFDSRCWDRVLPHLAGPAIAVDLPGRGRRPVPLDTVTFADCAVAVADDVDRAGFDDVVLVGHSLAGCSLPRAMALLEGRVRHVVFVACMVPPHGTANILELGREVQEHIAESRTERRDRMDAATAKVLFGNDLDEEQFGWCVEILVPEAHGLTAEPVDLSGLGSAVPRTWIRTMLDAILTPEMQLRFAARTGHHDSIDLEAGHMCMIGQPEKLADVLNRIAVASEEG